MKLREMIECMRGQVLRGSNEVEFQAVRTENAELARFATLREFVAWLPMKKGEPFEVKHGVTMLMLRAYNERAAKTLWSTLLAIAYEPLLASACATSPNLPRGEREQAGFTAFMEAIRTASKHDYLRSAPGFLARYTKLEVVHERTIEASKNDLVELVEYDEDQTIADRSEIFDPPVERVHAAREALEAALKKGVDLRDTRGAVGGGRASVPLTEIVAQAVATDDPRERRRAYERVWHARRRVALRKERTAKGASGNEGAP